MENSFDDAYVVYLRFASGTALEDIEVPVATCSSYEDARSAVRASPWLNGVVIRYLGDVGGSD